MRRNAKPIVLLVLLSLSLAACAQSARPGVRVRSVSTKLGLGITKTPTRQVDAGQPPLDIPPFTGFKRPPIKLPPPLERCPAAGLFDFPANPASIDISEKPEVGTYQWKNDVTVLDVEKTKALVGSDTFMTQPIQDGTTRIFGRREIIARVADPIEAALGIAPVVGPSTKRDSYVYTLNSFPAFGPSLQSTFRSDFIRVQPGSYADTSLSNQDVGEGMAPLLTSWNEGDPLDPRNQRFYITANTPPPYLISLPVTTGKTIKWNYATQSVNSLLLAVLGATVVPGAEKQGPRWTYSFTGDVAGRFPVDACGDMVDSWLIEGTLTVTRENLHEDQKVDVWKYDYSYGVATQMGALVVYERLAYPAAEPSRSLRQPDVELTPEVKPFFIVESSIGQLRPTPPSD